METVIHHPIVRRAIPSGILGMIFLLTTELMLFAGFISAYIVNRAGSMAWPPANQPRLPIEVTAVNTVILMGSAVTLLLFAKQLKRKNFSLKFLALSIFLGTIFLAIQGTEWVKLIGFGLTTTSSLFGSFFYLLIGIHALHVTAGLLLLFYLYFSITKTESPERLQDRTTVCSLYWFFVVGIWPVLYTLIYLI